jgi:hypothetical protein
MAKKKKKKEIPLIKKNIKAFLANEEGKISKKNALDLGIGVAALSLLVSRLFPPQEVDAIWSHSSCHSSHSSCHYNCHANHGSCHSNCHYNCHANHGSCHSNCHYNCHANHGSCHSNHGSCHSNHGSCHSSCHSNHGSCHSSHGSCHSNHGSCHSNHGSCHFNCHSNHGSCHSSCHSNATSTPPTCCCGSCGHSSCHYSHPSCPFILLWNGKRFILENNILPQSENLERKELITNDLYKIENKIEAENGFYKLRIVEFEREKSFFKDFKLIRVVHPKNTQIGIFDEKIIAYDSILSPFQIKSSQGDIKPDQLFKKKRGEDVDVFFKGNLKNYDFFITNTRLRGNREIKKEIEKILLLNKVENIKDFVAKALIITGALSVPTGPTYAIKSIHYYYCLDNNKKEEEIGISHPRENLSSNIFNLPDFIKNKEKIKIKMKWTDTHEIAPVGLARKLSLNKIKKEEIKLSSIHRFEEKENHSKKLSKQGILLAPGEFLTLNFPALKAIDKNKEQETFIFSSKGYYRPL